jgi:hypothetical protein
MAFVLAMNELGARSQGYRYTRPTSGYGDKIKMMRLLKILNVAILAGFALTALLFLPQYEWRNWRDAWNWQTLGVMAFVLAINELGAELRVYRYTKPTGKPFKGTVAEMQQEVLETIARMRPKEKAELRQELEKMLLKPPANSEKFQPPVIH